MAWITTKSGKHINTDWFDDDTRRKEKQMQAAQIQAEIAQNQETHKQYPKDNIRQFKKLDNYDKQTLNDATIKSKETNGWNFPGIKKDIDELELKLAKTRSENVRFNIYQRLKQLDHTITTQLQTIDKQYEDESALLSYRRRVRTALRRITNDK